MNRGVALALLALGGVPLAGAALSGCAEGGSRAESAGGGGGGGAGAGSNTTGGVGQGGELVCSDEDKCDNTCTDLATDPRNCGACGVTCVVPSATASCNAGTCALATCDDGFANCDGSLDNGCEQVVDCTAGGSCPTSCGTTGLLDCSDVCAPTCTLPPEACNLADDDCDTLCDNGAIPGCRVGVHRAFGPNGHYYGTSDTEATSLGYNIEFLNFFYLYAAPTGPLQPFFRCQKGGGQTFLTTATDCEIGVGPETIVGYISAVPDNCASQPLYRTRNGSSGAHFYTTSANERDNAVNNLGYVDEGIAGYIWPDP